jgi:kynurenine formamidase
LSTQNPNQDYGRWLDDLAAGVRFGSGDRLGTANLIDAAARRRAAESIRLGTCVSLARPISLSADGADTGLRVETFLGQIVTYGTRAPFAKPLETSGDTTCIEPHGVGYTHLDALNHMGRAGKWYGGYAVDDPQGPSVADLANHVLFTRGVLVDIPAVRGTDWVEDDAPVTGEDIDAALASQGAEFAPGDALLLYMGRDRFEAAGHAVDLVATATGSAGSGAGAGAARWMAEHDVSLLAWDFLDAFPSTDTEPIFPVHLLLTAIGLLLVDNCDLGPAAAQVNSSGRSTGALIVATPPVPRATGALVQPLFIQ